MPKQQSSSAADQLPIPAEVIERRIYLIRGHKVMLDSDLAELYGVPTKRLNEQVKRNLKRFPEDFMFQLTAEETKVLRSQIATSKDPRGGRRYVPYVFTEQGVAMLSSVLNSDRAIQVNIAIMRAFVRLRDSSQHTRTWPASWKRWRKSTMLSSVWSLTPSANSWNHRSLVDVQLGSQARNVADLKSQFVTSKLLFPESTCLQGFILERYIDDHGTYWPAVVQKN